jgi:16S rRNA U1498 N3-methylase RsmE
MNAPMKHGALAPMAINACEQCGRSVLHHSTPVALTDW